MPGWNPFHPPPAPPGLGKGKVLPEFRANWLSFLTFFWVNPLLSVGFSRPLEEDDLWELPDEYLTAQVTDRVETQFYARCLPEKRPKHLRDRLATEAEKEAANQVPETPEETQTGDEGKEDKTSSKSSSDKKASKKPDPYDESCFLALYYTFFSRIWWAGGLCLISDTLKTTSPLVVKALLNWLTASYLWVHLTEEEKASGLISAPQGIGRGIGLVIGLFLIQQVSSVAFNHCYQISYITGIHVRTAVIGSIFRKSLRLSGRARLDHSVGQITTMISKDATGLEQFMYYAHQIWVSPIQIILGFGLLIGTLGYSALVGLGVLVLGLPFQGILGFLLFQQRAKGLKITDNRVKLTTEVLQGIRLLKAYAWETFYAQKIGDYRRREIKILKQTAAVNASLVASVTFLPTIAAILSFITYSLTGHDLNVAVIFSAFYLFNIIRTPLIFFPLVAASLSEALVALGRISKFLAAEEMADSYTIESDLPTMIDVDGDFTWEVTAKKLVEIEAARVAEAEAKKAAPQTTEKAKKQKKGKAKKGETDDKKVDEKEAEKEDQPTEGGKNGDSEEEKPFELTDLKLQVPRDSFVAIVGPVGSGKSSVLQALVGEMRKTKGNVRFRGSLAYVSQTPWVKNATIRDNIVFDRDVNEKRLRACISACCLEPDLEILPHGEYTEIGEKGINLSGGQKARISLARAAYSESDIILLDDPLSAVDAHVGRKIMDDCLLSGPLSDRTRVLVTHALHFLDKVDKIYVLDKGKIIESGSYQELLDHGMVFSSLIAEYGTTQKAGRTGPTATGNLASAIDEAANKEASAALMQAEERNTGAVTWVVYKKYFRYAGGLHWVPIILVLIALNESAQVANSLFLSFWTGQSIHGFSQNDYIAVYAGIGAGQALTSFLLCLVYVYMGLFASLNLFSSALNHILGSPVSFFDTTPIGRITNRLSKDQDTLDAELAIILWNVSVSFAAVLGTAGLVFYTFPYLGILFAPAIVIYYIAALYYRRTSVETKRLDSILRSVLFASFSETLTGLPTIRAYRNQASHNVTKNAQLALDRENRALYLTVTIQRWLALRLDFFANILLLGIGIFAICLRHTVNPSKVGLVLTYTLSITSIFTELISTFARNEQNMNAVERIVHYAELPEEGATTTPDDPPSTWPPSGNIEFSHVDLAYRQGLPLVLKDVSFTIRPGEKIGVVGRTGAGKSSLIQALLRTAELSGGKITIDGIDVSKIGLDVLRHRIALVPQDSVLFVGSLRDNLDPQRLRTDAELISVLQRAWLLPRGGSIDPAVEAKFSLDAPVGDDGSNFSAGEKQLLALSRALVKNSKIIILDEATSSVDVETDAKVQRTIQNEFASATLLCIAHRLNTIAYYDRVIVMDAGSIAEFDTVLNLFDKESSIFRSLCDEANLTLDDIVRIRSDHMGGGLV